MIRILLVMLFLLAQFQIVAAGRGVDNGEWADYWEKSKENYKDATGENKPGSRLGSGIASLLETTDREYNELKKVVGFAGSAVSAIESAKKTIRNPSTDMEEKMRLVEGMQALEEDWLEKVNVIELKQFVKAAKKAIKSCNSYGKSLTKVIGKVEDKMDEEDNRAEKKILKKKFKALKKLRAEVWSLADAIEGQLVAMEKSKEVLMAKQSWATAFRSPEVLMGTLKSAVGKCYTFVRDLEAMEPDSESDVVEFDELNEKIAFFDKSIIGFTRDMSQNAMNIATEMDEPEHMFNTSTGKPDRFFIGVTIQWVNQNTSYKVGVIDEGAFEELEPDEQLKLMEKKKVKLLAYFNAFKTVVVKLDNWIQSQ